MPAADREGGDIIASEVAAEEVEAAVGVYLLLTLWVVVELEEEELVHALLMSAQRRELQILAVEALKLGMFWH